MQALMKIASREEDEKKTRRRRMAIGAGIGAALNVAGSRMSYGNLPPSLRQKYSKNFLSGTNAASGALVGAGAGALYNRHKKRKEQDDE